MTTLSWKEQRRLRVIEHELYRDDPRLAELLSRPTGPVHHLPRPAPPTRPAAPWRQRGSASMVSALFLSSAILLIFGGDLLDDMHMVLGGVITLGAFPLIVALVMVLGRSTW